MYGPMKLITHWSSIEEQSIISKYLVDKNEMNMDIQILIKVL